MCIATILTIALSFTYTNVKEMKDDLKDIKSEYNNNVKDLKSQILELKTDAKETVNQIRDDSKAAVLSTKEYSENELSRISTSTRQLALTETQNQLDNIFATDKIQNMIQTNAVREIKTKVVDIVSEQTKNVGDISDAAAEMRAYKFSGRDRLRSYFINPKRSLDSLIAKQLYDQIALDFFNQTDRQVKGDKINLLQSYDSNSLQLLRSGILPKNTTLGNELPSMIKDVNGFEYALDQTIWNIYRLRIITGIDFQILDIEAVNKWYKGLKIP